MENDPVPARPRPTFWTAFRPLWVASFISFWVLAADFHQKRASQIRVSARVTFEGNHVDRVFSVKIGGKLYEPGVQVPIGLRKVLVESPEMEPASHWRWIWYGSNSLGSFDLTRPHGELRVRVQPQPDHVTVSGRFATRTLGTKTNEFNFGTLPVGDYEVYVGFEKVMSQKTWTVNRGQVTTATMVVALGRLEISSDPPDADFSIQSENGGFTAQGKLPCVFRFLPPGRYVLQTSRENSRKEQTVKVKDGETTKATIKLEGGGANRSEPHPAEQPQNETVRASAASWRQYNLRSGERTKLILGHS